MSTLKARTKFAIVYPVIKINHSHEYKDQILPDRVFPLKQHAVMKERKEKMMGDVIQTSVHLTVID